MLMHRYKKVHSIVIRGAHFCPAAVDCISEYLDVTKNNMIMGVPDSSFPFPFAKLNGVRLAVSSADPVTITQSRAHLWQVLSHLHLPPASSTTAPATGTPPRPHHNTTTRGNTEEMKTSYSGISRDTT